MWVNKGKTKGKLGSDGWTIVSADAAYAIRAFSDRAATASGEPPRGRPTEVKGKSKTKGKKGGEAQPALPQTWDRRWGGGWTNEEWREWAQTWWPR